MPRRKQRFSFLKRAWKASAGTASGGVLAQWPLIDNGTNKPDRTAPALPAGSLKKLLYALTPFGIAATAGQGLHQISISKYSNDQRTTLSLGNTEVGYVPIDAGIAGTLIKDSNFYPAIARVRISSGSNNPSKLSGLTKQNYNYKGAKSYGIPFGKTATNPTEFAMQVALDDAVKSVAGLQGVTFEPELRRESGKTGTNGT